MSNFDPDQFMNSTVDGPLETEVRICPAGEYQNAFITDFDSKAFETFQFTYKQGPNAGQPGEMLKFTVPFRIPADQKMQEELGRDQAIVEKQLIIDRDENGGIATGPNKNVELGRLYDAAGINGPGASPGGLRGKGPFVVLVVHEEFTRKDGSKGKKAAIGKVTRQV